MSGHRRLFIFIIVALSMALFPILGAYASETVSPPGAVEDKYFTHSTLLTTPTPISIPKYTPNPPGMGWAGPSVFLPTTILDDFNRADGSIGSNWSGDTGGYTIVGNQLDVGTSQDIYWNVSSFSVDQEAFVTLATIDPSASEIALILKAQSSSGLGAGLVEVFYNPSGGYIQVWTYLGGGWTLHGGNIHANFVNGDQLAARASAHGFVEVYRNGVLLATRNITSWPLYANSGYIGLFNLNASNAALDDFGGGSLAPSPSPTPTPLPCYDPQACNPVSSYAALWKCDIPECVGSDWRGAVISWPSWSAYPNNARTADQSRTVYARDGNFLLYPYMGPWADGCHVFVNSGTVVIIEWERGTNVWVETQLETGESHTITLVPPQNNAMIEGPNEVFDTFSVTITNCTPQPLDPTALRLERFEAVSLSSSSPILQFTVLVGIAGAIVLFASIKKKQSQGS